MNKARPSNNRATDDASIVGRKAINGVLEPSKAKYPMDADKSNPLADQAANITWRCEKARMQIPSKSEVVIGAL
jgi:hypothetical protein